MKHPDLINLSARIQRYADGMTVNRDALARDMARVVAELSARRDLGVPQDQKPSEVPDPRGFADIFRGWK